MSLSGTAHAQDAGGACMMSKICTRPVAGRMKGGGVAAAKDAGIELAPYAGKSDGEGEARVAATERS